MFVRNSLMNGTVVFDNKAVETLVTADDAIARRAPDSAAMMDYWEQIEDILGGRRTIVAKGKTYLPQFPNELKSDYEFRLATSKFTNVFRDISEDLASKPFEKEVTFAKTVTVPEEIKTFGEDVDGQGNNLTVFAATTFFNGITAAVDWVFVDFPNEAPPAERVRTRQEEKAQNLRPFWSHVKGMNVLEVKTKMIGAKEHIIRMRVKEYLDGDDYVRLMEHDPALMIATWTLYKKVKNKTNPLIDEWVVVDQGTFSIGIIPMVPFITGRRLSRTYEFTPMLRDAAELQIELYQAESGLKFAKTLVAFPMLAGNGVNPAKDETGKVIPVGIGPGRALYAPMNGDGNHGEWVFIEPAATSMNFLSTDVEAMKKDLRELGKQPLTAQSGNVTVITSAVAAGKSRSAVGQCGLLLKDALENAYRVTAMWMNISFEPELIIYDEYDDFSGGETDVAQLQAMRINRDISQETLWEEMQRRRVLSAEFDPEKEKERILAETPGDPVDGEMNDDANFDPTNPDNLGKTKPKAGQQTA